jgi:hypothetical protein
MGGRPMKDASAWDTDCSNGGLGRNASHKRFSRSSCSPWLAAIGLDPTLDCGSCSIINNAFIESDSPCPILVLP